MSALTTPSPAQLAQTGFHIGSIPVYGEAILAPMDGFSDLPFRSLCRSFGSALSYTPFVNAMEVLARHPRLERLLEFDEAERPVVYQLFDSDEDRLLRAAQAVLARHPDVLDINMGCSVRCVSGRGAGAGLLRDPRKIARLIATLSRALPVPVTAKIRLGWDAGSRNFLDVARAVAENGGALIAIHARTREQGYSGLADWDAIAAVKDAVNIPVVGNGDVQRPADIARMRRHTRCDAVMIGRGAIGNPWIFQGRERAQVPRSEFLATIRHHLQGMLDVYGPREGVILFRKHLTRYLAPLQPPGELRAAILAEVEPPRLVALLDQLEYLPSQEAAV